MDIKEIKPVNCDRSGNDKQCKNCLNCGWHQDDEQCEKRYRKSAIGSIDNTISAFSTGHQTLTKVLSAFTSPFDFLNGQKWWKYASIAVFIFIGVFTMLTKQPPWNKLNIVQGEDYATIYFAGEYLIDTDEENIALNIGVTKEVKKVTITEKYGNEEPTEKTYGTDEAFEVTIDEDAHYTLKVTYVDGTSEKIEFRKKQ